MSVVSADTSLLVLGQALILCEPPNLTLSEVLTGKEKWRVNNYVLYATKA